jgi:hypothetical protein
MNKDSKEIQKLKSKIREAIIAELSLYETKKSSKIKSKDEDFDSETPEYEEETFDDSESENTGSKFKLSKDEKIVQYSLEKALDGARAIGDKKLEDQIGNTITFFVRSHISK